MTEATKTMKEGDRVEMVLTNVGDHAIRGHIVGGPRAKGGRALVQFEGFRGPVEVAVKDLRLLVGPEDAPAAEFSAGPWEIRRRKDTVDEVVIQQSVLDGRYWTGREVGSVNTPDGEAEGHANGRLIAKAPEMFGLLGQIAEAFEQQGEGGAVMLSRRFVGEVRDIIRHVKGAK